MATSSFDNRPLVSVIIPVYNGERYLAAAVKSVLAQTYANWELFIVNDGSYDGTAALCDGFAAQDPRIKVFHQSNGGVNAARAKGIDNAAGDYLTFLDADDTFTPDAIEKMSDGFSEKVDVVYCDTVDHFYTQKDYILALWKGTIKPGICTKMFRMSLFKQLDYSLDKRLVMGEDLLLNSMYALHINGARSISHDCYIINKENSTSVTKTFKHNWEYEKYFFSKVEELFVSKCSVFPYFEQIQLLINKCWLNAMKYVMLDNGHINYNDTAFKKVQSYFKHHIKDLGPSEMLIFMVRNPYLYRKIISSAEFARFVLVGLLATALHYGIYLLLDLVIPPNPAYATGYVLSFLFNFYLTSRFTFKKKATVKKGVGFGLSHLVNFGLHMGLLNLFLYLGLSEAIAPVPVYCICIPVNFLLVRFVFNRL